MKTLLKTAAVAAIALTATIGMAHADSQPKPKGGTVKGAAVGAVAGHMMGGHAKSGAVAGAVIGHHERVKSEKRINEGKSP